MMFFELNETVYSRWPCALEDNTKAHAAIGAGHGHVRSRVGATGRTERMDTETLLSLNSSLHRDQPYGAAAGRRQLQLQDRPGIHAALRQNRVFRLRGGVGSVGVDLRIVSPAAQKAERHIDVARVPIVMLPTNHSFPRRRAMVMYLGGTPLRTRVSSNSPGPP